MSTSSPKRQPIRESLKDHFERVDRACQAHWGISGMVWRALDQIVSLGTLALAGYAIDQGAAPMLSLAIAAIIISGPKIIEWWLVREDYVEYEQVKQADSDD